MAVKNFWRVNRDGKDGAGLVPIRHDVSDTAVEGAQAPMAHTAFVDMAGQFTAGVWACNAGTLEIRDLAVNEACYLIEGTVVITDEYGHTETFHAGEGFVLPRGFSGTWHMPVAIRKYNAMHNPEGGLTPMEG